MIKNSFFDLSGTEDIMSAIKNGIYSIVSSSITQGIDSVKCQDGDIYNFLQSAKTALSDSAKKLQEEESCVTDTVDGFYDTAEEAATDDIWETEAAEDEFLNCPEGEELQITAQTVANMFIEHVEKGTNSAEFFMKIEESGLNHTASAWGRSIGNTIVKSANLRGNAASVTLAASSTIMSAIYGELYKYTMSVFLQEKVSEQRLNTIRQLQAAAIKAIREEREILLKSSFIKAENRKKVFNESLNSIATALNTNDVELLSCALNKITAQVGGTILFNSFEEFDDFMQDTSLALEF